LAGIVTILGGIRDPRKGLGEKTGVILEGNENNAQESNRFT
jgi:hypothetical protein